MNITKLQSEDSSIHSSEMEKILQAGPSRVLEFAELHQPLLDFIDVLEPFRVRKPLSPTKHKVILHSYLSSITRWRKVLSYFRPRRRPSWKTIERLHRIAWNSVIPLLDTGLDSSNTVRDIIVTCCVLNDFRHLAASPAVDSSVADHIRVTLQARLSILFT